jgi:uncharacterized membrane protein required for colicin V production
MPGWILKTLAFLVTAFIVFRLWQWLAMQTSDAFKVSGLGQADSALGSIFGLMKASLICAGFFWLGGVIHATFLEEKLKDTYIAADVVDFGNSEFALMSKATPMFMRWYKEASAYAVSTDKEAASTSKASTP